MTCIYFNFVTFFSREYDVPLLQCTDSKVTISNGEAREEYMFNNVFNNTNACTNDQRVIYDTMAKPLLDHAMSGYNVCLFAYGQTGSGKTYT